MRLSSMQRHQTAFAPRARVVAPMAATPRSREHAAHMRAARISHLVRQAPLLRRLREDDGAWDRFVTSTDGASPLQSTAWATAKAPAGWSAQRLVVDAGSGPIGGQVLLRPLGPGPFSVGYIPHGPLATEWDLASVDAFSTALHELAQQRRLTHVTAEPAVGGGEPSRLLSAAGWTRGDAIQPASTLLVDLDRSEQAIWSSLYGSTRRYVNRARKAGCSVRVGDGSDLPILQDIVEQTAARAGFIPRPFEAHRAVCEAFAARGEALLLVGLLPDGSVASAKLILMNGRRACQLYGGLSDRGIAERAGHFFEWEAIRRSRALGARWFDMWGCPTTGIAHFKQGFGGRLVHYAGAWDLVRSPVLRKLVSFGRRSGRQLAGYLTARQGGRR
jgi:lipid II:glycine glycyltransferase (peptidoglycan interpeptide bridge formation enzyme)